MLYNICMLDRHAKREKLVTVLYQHLLLDKDLYACFMDFYPDPKDEFALSIIDDLYINEKDYIEEISAYLTNWTFDRLNYVEQAVLLEALSEIRQNINDKAVIIDEAVIMCQKYCDVDTYKYINGVLDNLCSNLP